MTGCPKDEPAWLPIVAEAMVEALPRLYGQSSSAAISNVIRALCTALAEGQVERSLNQECSLALMNSSLAKAPDGPIVVTAEGLAWQRWHQQRECVIDELIRRAQISPLAGLDEHAQAEAAEAVITSPEGCHLDAAQRQAVHASLRHSVVLLEGGARHW